MKNTQLLEIMDIGQAMHEGTHQKPVDVLLVERSVLLRKAICKSITASQQVKKITEVARIANAAVTLQSVVPDAVLLGTSVSLEECLNVAKLAKQHHTHIGVIVLRINTFPEMVQLLIKSGVHGILDETALEQDIEFAIKCSTTGRTFHSQQVHKQMVASFGKSQLLTGSEMQTLLLVMHGADNYTIARNLSVTVKTVEAHLTRIYGKLCVHTRAQAILRAQELHLHLNGNLSL